MNGAVFLFLTSPVFLFILIIGVFLSGGNVALETILRSRTKVSNVVVMYLWPMLASLLTGSLISISALTIRRYKDEFLKPIVVPYAAAIGDDFVLMNENCRSHSGYLVNDFLLEEKSSEWNGQHVLRARTQ